MLDSRGGYLAEILRDPEQLVPDCLTPPILVQQHGRIPFFETVEYAHEVAATTGSGKVRQGA